MLFSKLSLFKTYSGFRRHIIKRKLNTENIYTADSSNNFTEILPNDITHNIDKNLDENYTVNDINVPDITVDDINLHDIIKNFYDSDINDSFSIFIQNLYSCGIPDTSIDKILQCISQLINPGFQKILDNVEKANVICWLIVSTFLSSFDIYLTRYKRETRYKKHIVHRYIGPT